MRGGPRRFPQNSSCSAVLRCRLTVNSAFRVRGCHPLWPGFPACSAMLHLRHCRRSYNPGRCHRTTPVWAGARSLATTCAIVLYFLFLWVLRCFSSPRSPRSLAPVPESLPAGFPIRTSAGHRAFAPHRGFSQLVTSFFASESHRHPPCALLLFLLCLFGHTGNALKRYSPADSIHKTRSISSTTSQLKSLLYLVLRSHHVNDLFLKVENNGFEPLTPCLQSRCSTN